MSAASGSGGGSWGGGGATNATDLMDFICGGCTNSTTVPQSIKAYIGNVASSSIQKNASWTLYGLFQNSNSYQASGFGFWNNDTNALTGLEVVPSAGNITSGTCSLYGMQ